MVSDVVHNQTLIYNRTITNSYISAISDYAKEKGTPIDENCRDMMKSLGQNLCNQNYVAFIFTYVVSEDRQHIRILNYCERKGMDFVSQLPKNVFDGEYEYIPSPEELELWDGSKTYLDYDDLFFDGACVSAIAIDDAYGNRIVSGSGVSYEAVKKDIVTNFNQLTIIILLSIIVLTICMYFIITNSVLKPAKKISKFISTFIKDGKRTSDKLEQSGSYEFDIISSSINVMTENIDTYIENINKLNNAQASQKAELDIASRIQQGFLDSNRLYAEDCEIFASMAPAKNVGGDLYNYMVLKDGKIFIAIADVSGKGIPASMYMAVTLVILKQSVIEGIGPAGILAKTNNVITANNRNMFFATAFVGIYDPETREFTYSNAGHLPPYIIKDKPIPLNGARNLVLGLYSNEEYTEETITLDYGDIVFLYTDGVTEAIDENKRFYGEKRLEEALNDFLISREENIVEYIDARVKDFMKNTEQFDDLTMLSCTVKHRIVLELLPQTKEFSKIKEAILNSNLEHSMKLSLCVAAEEIFINICSYAFEGKSTSTDNFVIFTFEHSDRILLKFEDNGFEYDPTKDVDYDIDYNPDEQLGGLGKLIAFTIADKIKYEYTDNTNILTIIKYLREV